MTLDKKISCCMIEERLQPLCSIRTCTADLTQNLANYSVKNKMGEMNDVSLCYLHHTRIFSSEVMELYNLYMRLLISNKFPFPEEETSKLQ